ncbi:MAG: hypothetical protein M1832_001130 [Thelocarpon impressellum]|nr:MAG: hypothetical protein M1832_001130 [Thelocarpon impressellum]
MAVDSPARTPSWLGIPMKHVSLITLVFQNSALILVMHYSRIMPLVGGHRFFPSTAVFLNELLKLAICLTVALYDISRNLPPSTPATSLFSALYNAAVTADSWKLAIPASLYTLQNSLQYVAVSNLDAASFQVTYQLKILTTALFSVSLLGRSLSVRKWVALVLLTLGVAIVQLPSADSSALAPLKDAQSRFYFPRSLQEIPRMAGAGSEHLNKRSATYEGIQEDQGLQHPQMNASIGLLAVVAACTVSGLAGVYFEKVLKDTSSSLWIRNVQMAFYSLFPAFLFGVVMKDGEEIARRGFFDGYNWVVWTSIAFQALGGVMVALCVNYADNIAKNFATSISIIVSFLASVWFFDFDVTANFLAGTAVVMFATYLYSSQDRHRPPPINIAKYEKTTIGSDAYFDDNAKPPTPFKSTALSTSRPASPMRHHSRVASEKTKFAKRGD